MPTHLIQRIDLDLLYPEFCKRLLDLLALCSSQGADFYAISGYRSYTEQQVLFFQGRTRAGPQVTNAMGGESAHNFGLAADLCRDLSVERKGLQPGWNAADYEVLRTACPQVGLSWGGLYKSPDRPHVNFPGYETKAQLAALNRVWKQTANLKSVWDTLPTP